MDAIRERLRETLKRAGLSNVPSSVVVVALVVAAAAIVVGLWHWWPRGDTAIAVSAESGASSSSTSPAGVASAKLGPSGTDASAEATSNGGLRLYVHVVGAVRRPGLYVLPAGARVADAVGKAGGLLGNAADRGANLARPLTDGEQIVIPTQDELESSGARPGAGGTGGTSANTAGTSSSAAGPININTADTALLDTLPGVGPSTAQRIVADREANGPFASVDDLARVTGIGPKKLESLRDLVVAR